MHIQIYLLTYNYDFVPHEQQVFFKNGLYYLKVKYYTRLLHSDDAHNRLKQGSNSSKKRNK
jgi:hypothetical protein